MILHHCGVSKHPVVERVFGQRILNVLRLNESPTYSLLVDSTADDSQMNDLLLATHQDAHELGFVPLGGDIMSFLKNLIPAVSAWSLSPTPHRHQPAARAAGNLFFCCGSCKHAVCNCPDSCFAGVAQRATAKIPVAAPTPVNRVYMGSAMSWSLVLPGHSHLSSHPQDRMP